MITSRVCFSSLVLLAASLVLTACQTDQQFPRTSKTEFGNKISSTDFGNAVDPLVNAFMYLKDFDRVEESQRSAYDVIRQKYYQNGKSTMTTEYVLNGFFGVHLYESIIDKKKAIRHLGRVGRTQLMLSGLKVYKSYDVSAVYASSGDCAFIKFAKKLKEPMYDNDQGNPDFHATYSGCGGLTVTPLEFIKKLAVATPADYALYAAHIKAKQAQESGEFAQHDDAGICHLAGIWNQGEPFEWSKFSGLRKFVDEAQARGLTTKKCSKLVGQTG